MEVLLGGLSAKSIDNQSIKLLVSSKYHCELAGEGLNVSGARPNVSTEAVPWIKRIKNTSSTKSLDLQLNM